MAYWLVTEVKFVTNQTSYITEGNSPSLYVEIYPLSDVG